MREAGERISTKYEPVEAGDDLRLALRQKTFRKETDPTYDSELHKVQKNNHDGTYVVDGNLHPRKDLQVVRGAMTPKKSTAVEKQKDKVGKAAFSPVVKDLIGSTSTVEEFKKMISDPRKSRSKKIGYHVCRQQKSGNQNQK